VIQPETLNPPHAASLSAITIWFQKALVAVLSGSFHEATKRDIIGFSLAMYRPGSSPHRGRRSSLARIFSQSSCRPRSVTDGSPHRVASSIGATPFAKPMAMMLAAISSFWFVVLIDGLIHPCTQSAFDRASTPRKKPAIMEYQSG